MKNIKRDVFIIWGLVLLGIGCLLGIIYVDTFEMKTTLTASLGMIITALASALKGSGTKKGE